MCLSRGGGCNETSLVISPRGFYFCVVLGGCLPAGASATSLGALVLRDFRLMLTFFFS